MAKIRCLHQVEPSRNAPPTCPLALRGRGFGLGAESPMQSFFSCGVLCNCRPKGCDFRRISLNFSDFHGFGGISLDFHRSPRLTGSRLQAACSNPSGAVDGVGWDRIGWGGMGWCGTGWGSMRWCEGGMGWNGDGMGLGSDGMGWR